jgi:hypothetical protein
MEREARCFWSKKFNKDVTPRWVLQHFGTEVMRQNMHDAIWIDSCMARYDGEPTVIADTRFENEIKTIREWGQDMLVKRGQDPDWFTELRGRKYNTCRHTFFRICMGQIRVRSPDKNDGTLEDLYHQVDDLIVSNKITHTPSRVYGHSPTVGNWRKQFLN